MITAEEANKLYRNIRNEYTKHYATQYIISSALEKIEEQIIKNSNNCRNYTVFDLTEHLSNVRGSRKFTLEEFPIYDEETISKELHELLSKNYFIVTIDNIKSYNGSKQVILSIMW
jgi:hypothetical protein